MEIKEILRKKAQIVDRALAEYLPEKDVPQGRIYEAMRYSLFAGGKRLRPAIVLLACEMCGGDANQAIPFACAIEMIHTYSLIHDDLPAMDNDKLRRGKPTNHVVYGEGMAILAGDALLNKAFEIIASQTTVSAETAMQALGILATASGTEGMIGGQVIDIENEGKAIDAKTLETLHLLKTGALIRAAGNMGAAVAGADAATMERVDAYCKNLGIAFQIQDDILDVTGSQQELGKPIGSDAENAKTTYVTLYGIDQAEKLVADYTEKAVTALEPFGERGAALRALAEYLIGRKA